MLPVLRGCSLWGHHLDGSFCFHTGSVKASGWTLLYHTMWETKTGHREKMWETQWLSPEFSFVRFTTAVWAGNSPVSGWFRKKSCRPRRPAFQLHSWGSGRRCSPTLECHCRWSLECPRPVTDVTSGISGLVIGWGPIIFQRQQREVASEMTLMHLISSMIHLRIYVHVCRDIIKHTQPHSYQKHIGQLMSTPTFIGSVGSHCPAGDSWSVSPCNQGAEQFQFFSFISSAIS